MILRTGGGALPSTMPHQIKVNPTIFPTLNNTSIEESITGTLDLTAAKMSSQHQSEEFKQAAKDSKNMKSRPENAELLQVRPMRATIELLTDTGVLQLYALFKQGSQDPPIEESPAPGTWDMKVRDSQVLSACCSTAARIF